MHPVNRVEIQDQQPPQPVSGDEKNIKTRKAAVKSAAKKSGSTGTNKTPKTAQATKTAQKPLNTASKNKSPKIARINLKDVLMMKKTDLNKLVKDIDLKTLYFAMAGADNKVKKTIITHLGKLQLKSYNKLFAENLPVSDSDVEKAQKVLVSKIKKLIS
ncbi:MAG TPA: FliG C-terminal domain-containing protein [Bacteroidales bacterium]|nr:FliG C-terminal domain-containing protein [Bacteroidales bacterium]